VINAVRVLALDAKKTKLTNKTKGNHKGHKIKEGRPVTINIYIRR